MSTLKVGTIQDTSAGNSSTPAQIYEGRAKIWVTWNGTGTVAIYESYNVSSVTDNGTGEYQINFSANMANINYCLATHVRENDAGAGNRSDRGMQPMRTPMQVDEVKVGTFNCTNGTLNDNIHNGCAIIGDM